MKHYYLIPSFFFLLPVCMLISLGALSQADSATIVHTHWQTRKIAPGIRLKEYWFDHALFQSNQNICILEVKLTKRNKIDLGVEPQQLKRTSEFGLHDHALAAMNGTFFDMKNGGSVDYIRSDGKVVNTVRVNNNKRAVHQRAAIVVNKGRVTLEEWDGTDNWEEKLKGEDVMETGPLLVWNKELTSLDSTAFNNTRHPRTALATRGNRVYLITVDGRNEKASGMSLFELARVLKWMKADKAINLDGGGSTTLWINDGTGDGIINHPSDNKKWEHTTQFKAGMDLDNLPADSKKWDHGGERPVANVVLVKRG